ncbi:MAG: CsbD family protein, partial [Wenzhouxiangella sp.]
RAELFRGSLAQGKWDRLTAKVKQQWGDLTDDEVKKAEGNKDELIARIREKYGESKESIAEKLNEMMAED